MRCIFFLVVLLGFPLDYITILLALAGVLGGASIGLVTALITSRAQMTAANSPANQTGGSFSQGSKGYFSPDEHV